MNHDATFIVLNSGTYEIIGIRDRAQQTLYVTSVIVRMSLRRIAHGTVPRCHSRCKATQPPITKF
jgi:hypothetical protein